jgi:hypothetical protein
MSAVTQLASPYDTTPDTVIEALGEHRGPVFVDLDETLYLRNSTEDFIDLARPGLVALVLLRALDVVRPWQWTGGDSTRDVWRVRLIWTLFPWTRALWRAHVQRLAHEFANQQLVRALQGRSDRLVILTAGFQPIAGPLVAALGFPDAQVIAARLTSFEDRRNGKLHAAVSTLGHETVSSGLFVTDSLDDLPLLAKCARPLRTIWPQARFRHALARIYFPGEYIAKVKRPGERYISRVIVWEDLGFWVLSSVELATHPLLHVIGMAVLQASFWTIYERGYVDNDWAAAHLERDGKLSASFWQAPVATARLQPWIWALASGALAVYLLHGPTAAPMDFAKWMSVWITVLVGTNLIFHLYNRIDKSTRIWLFASLQLARSAAFVVLVPVNAIGAVALGAHVLTRWLPYSLYRLGNGDWPEIQLKLVRLLFFLVLATLFAVTQGSNVLVNWTALLLFAWNVIHARRDLKAVLTGIRRIDRARGSSAP